MQKPHPADLDPRRGQPRVGQWAAEHQYPYVALAPPLHTIDEIFDYYDEVAAGGRVHPHVGAPGLRHPGERGRHRREGYEEGRHFFWQLGTTFGVAPRHWLQPPGYVTRAAKTSRREIARTGINNVTPGGPAVSYEEAHATHQIVSGTPDTVIKKLQHIIDVADPPT